MNPLLKYSLRTGLVILSLLVLVACPNGEIQEVVVDGEVALPKVNPYPVWDPTRCNQICDQVTSMGPSSGGFRFMKARHVISPDSADFDITYSGNMIVLSNLPIFTDDSLICPGGACGIPEYLIWVDYADRGFYFFGVRYVLSTSGHQLQSYNGYSSVTPLPPSTQLTTEGNSLKIEIPHDYAMSPSHIRGMATPIYVKNQRRPMKATRSGLMPGLNGPFNFPTENLTLSMNRDTTQHYIIPDDELFMAIQVKAGEKVEVEFTPDHLIKLTDEDDLDPWFHIYSRGDINFDVQTIPGTGVGMERIIIDFPQGIVSNGNEDSATIMLNLNTVDVREGEFENGETISFKALNFSGINQNSPSETEQLNYKIAESVDPNGIVACPACIKPEPNTFVTYEIYFTNIGDGPVNNIIQVEFELDHGHPLDLSNIVGNVWARLQGQFILHPGVFNPNSISITNNTLRFTFNQVDNNPLLHQRGAPNDRGEIILRLPFKSGVSTFPSFSASGRVKFGQNGPWVDLDPEKVCQYTHTSPQTCKFYDFP